MWIGIHQLLLSCIRRCIAVGIFVLYTVHTIQCLCNAFSLVLPSTLWRQEKMLMVGQIKIVMVGQMPTRGYASAW